MLLGNGVSVAFNEDLLLGNITQKVINRIEAQTGDGTAVVKAMKAIAQHASHGQVASEKDFEVLVGAFDSESRALDLLTTLAGIMLPGDPTLGQSIEHVRKFVEEVRDTGISHVLEVIYEASESGVKKSEKLRSTLSAIKSSFDGNISFGNLNYDTILLAALMRESRAETADLGNPHEDRVEVSIASEKYDAIPLRQTQDSFPEDRRIRLLHLHGSLTYWFDPVSDRHVKLTRDQLSANSPWEAVRSQSTSLSPSVVLATQRDKSAHVIKQPFALAYEMFQRGLTNSNYLLVIGYSFKDECVNSVLREDFHNREVPPRVLVVTKGDSPSEMEVEVAFGWKPKDGEDNEWLTINRCGADGLETTDDWKSFIYRPDDQF